MTGFSADWLALREPYDGRARNRDVLEAVVAAVGERTSIGVVDLACGTGATLRAIGAHLPARQDWRLVDNDLSLLARTVRPDGPGLTVTAVPVDLNRDLEAALDGPIDLVTTSALLDLVSGAWLERFAVEAAARRLPVYAALSYDGRVALDPCDPADDAIIAAFNRHQQTDKGFGPALGPDAATTAMPARIDRFTNSRGAIGGAPLNTFSSNGAAGCCTSARRRKPAGRAGRRKLRTSSLPRYSRRARSQARSA